MKTAEPERLTPVFDPVGQYLATQADDNSLKIWRTDDWQLERDITAKPAWASSFRTSSGGYEIVTIAALLGQVAGTVQSLSQQRAASSFDPSLTLQRPSQTWPVSLGVRMMRSEAARGLPVFDVGRLGPPDFASTAAAGARRVGVSLFCSPCRRRHVGPLEQRRLVSRLGVRRPRRRHLGRWSSRSPRLCLHGRCRGKEGRSQCG
jgi:hypothetical protein